MSRSLLRPHCASLLVPLVALVSVSACSTIKEQASRTPEPVTRTSQPDIKEAPAPTPVAVAKPTVSGRYTGRLSSTLDPRRVAAQLSSRAVNVSTECSFKNETGYSGRAAVDVANGDAKLVKVSVNVPSQGQCDFDMSGFTQVKGGAMVELQHPRDGCTARMWEQGSQVTVAFSNCAARCSPTASFKYIWPVLIDRTNGQCD